MTKKKLAKKVSEETGVDAKKLERLPVKELEKLDELIPDQVEIVITEEVDVDELNAQAEVELEDAESEGEEPEVELEVMDEEEKPRRLVGHHPITKEPVYR